MTDMAKNEEKSGLSKERLAYLKSVIEDDIKKQRYYGAAIVVARHGEAGLHESIGYADAEQKRPLTKDSVYSLFSTTKALTNTLVFRAIEHGQFALTTKVSEIIPEFSGGMREDITYYHLLTHSSGLPSVWIPKPDMYIDVLEDIIQVFITKGDLMGIHGGTNAMKIVKVGDDLIPDAVTGE